MRNFALPPFIVCLAGCLMAQSKGETEKFDSSAVWQVPPQFLNTAHSACEA